MVFDRERERLNAVLSTIRSVSTHYLHNIVAVLDQINIDLRYILTVFIRNYVTRSNNGLQRACQL